MKTKPDMNRPIEMNFNDLDSLEVNLIGMAHDFAMHSDSEQVGAAGRAMKSVIPGWVAFMRDEFARNKNCGSTVIAMTRAFAALSAFSTMALAKDGRCKDSARKLGELFSSDLAGLVLAHFKSEEASQ